MRAYSLRFTVLTAHSCVRRHLMCVCACVGQAREYEIQIQTARLMQEEVILVVVHIWGGA